MHPQEVEFFTSLIERQNDLVRKSDIVVPFNDFFYRKALEHFPILNSRKDVMEIIPHGIDLPVPSPGLSAEFRRNLTPKGEKLILYTGRVAYQKGVDTLVEAFFDANLGDANLVIVGRKEEPYFENIVHSIFKTTYVSGNDPAALREAYKKGNTIAKIKFINDISRLELSSLLNAADLFVMPSRYESFCYSVGEAMTLGKPVICSEIQPFYENFADPTLELSITFDRNTEQKAIESLSKALQSALANLNKLSPMIERAKTYALENLTMDKMTDNYINAYQKAINDCEFNENFVLLNEIVKCFYNTSSHFIESHSFMIDKSLENGNNELLELLDATWLQFIKKIFQVREQI